MALIIVLQNVSDLKDISDYNYQVLVGDGTPERSRTIVAGKVIGHQRSLGWAELVRHMIRVAEAGK